MKKIMVAALAALFLAGCGEEFSTSETSETVNTEIPAASNTMTVTAGGDVTIHQVGGDYTVTTNTESNSGIEYDATNYDPEYSQATCRENGFFWCTIENRCLNQPADTGTCSTSAYEVKVIW